MQVDAPSHTHRNGALRHQAADLQSSAHTRIGNGKRPTFRLPIRVCVAYGEIGQRLRERAPRGVRTKDFVRATLREEPRVHRGIPGSTESNA